MDFIYQCDDRYAPFTGVSIYSLLENNKLLDSIRVFVIDDSISELNKSRLIQCVDSFGREISFLPADTLMNASDAKEMQKYKGTRKNTHSFLKMIAIDQLPDDVETITYLDSDTLVLNSLEQLQDIEMKDCIIAMALDSLVDEKKKLIGFDRSDPYYNSGVIYIDVKRWKEGKCRERVIEHSKHHSYGTVDQDLLNVEFKGEIYTLPPEFNFQPHHIAFTDKDYFSVFTHKNGRYYSEDEIKMAREHICIMHFFRYLGEQPWHKGNLHPCNDCFDSYLRRTPWSDYEKKEAQKTTLFVVEKCIYRILPKRLFLRLFMAFFTLKLKHDIRAGNK